MIPFLLSLLAAEPFDVAAHPAILTAHAEGAQLHEVTMFHTCSIGTYMVRGCPSRTRIDARAVPL
jgi:hypothetical protein